MTVRVGLSSVACFYMVSLAPGSWDIEKLSGCLLFVGLSIYSLLAAPHLLPSDVMYHRLGSFLSSLAPLSYSCPGSFWALSRTFCSSARNKAQLLSEHHHHYGVLYLAARICRVPVPRPTSLAPAPEAAATESFQAISAQR